MLDICNDKSQIVMINKKQDHWNLKQKPLLSKLSLGCCHTLLEILKPARKQIFGDRTQNQVKPYKV